MDTATNRILKTFSQQFRDAIEKVQSKKPNFITKPYEEDYCYLVDGIQRGAPYERQTYINDLKSLIDKVNGFQ